MSDSAHNQTLDQLEQIKKHKGPVGAPRLMFKRDKPKKVRERPRNITAERLREILDYNPDTGEFMWKPKPAGTVYEGQRSIMIDKAMYSAAQLAWLYVYGEWPEGYLRHRNGDSLDNSIANLKG